MAKLTTELLANLESPHDLSISPSGDYIVYGARSDWSRQGKRWRSSLWLAQVGVEKSSRQITPKAANCLYWTCRFSPVDNALVAVQSDRGKKQGEFIGIDLVNVSRTGGASDEDQVVELTPPDLEQAISKFVWSPDGKYIAYLSPDETSAETKARHERGQDEKVFGQDWSWNRVRIVDVESRKVTTLVSQDCHVYDLAWSSDSASIAYVTTKTPELGSSINYGSEIEVVSMSDRKVKSLSRFPNGVSDLCWVGNALWWRSNYDLSKALGMSSGCVYGMGIDGRDGEWSVKGSGKDDSAMGWAFGPGMQGGDTTGLFVTIQRGLSDVIHGLPDWDVVCDSKEHDIRAWDVWRKGGQQTVVAVAKSTSNSPTELYSIVDGRETCLSDHGRSVRDLDEIASARSIQATAQDGTMIEGVFITPSEKAYQMPPSGWPTVVIPHGGPTCKVGLGFDVCFEYVAPWLASHGYAVLSPNYRGSTGRGEKFLSQMLGHPGGKDYSDVIDILQSTIRAGLVDTHRVGIYGWSYGGCIAFVAVTRDSVFHFAAAGGLSGGTDWDIGVMTSDTPIYAISLAGRAPWLTTPDDTWNRRGSPVWHMAPDDGDGNGNGGSKRKKITTPFLILQGEDDDRVHMTHPRAFHHGCLAHGYVCEFVVYPREGHALIPPYEQAHYMDRLERLRAWFAKYLGENERVDV